MICSSNVYSRNPAKDRDPYAIVALTSREILIPLTTREAYSCDQRFGSRCKQK